MGYFKNYPLNKILIPRDFFRVPESWGMYLFRYQLMWSVFPHRPKTKVGIEINEVPYEERLGYLINNFERLRKSVSDPIPNEHREAFERFDDYRPIFETRGEYKRPKILVLETGGTALCKTDSDGLLKPQLTVEELIERMKKFNHLPQIGKWYDIVVERTEEKIDSAEMTPEKQYDMACRVRDEIHEHKPDGTVVLHGTDTMANTAQAWNFLLEHPSVPIILTGAMTPGEREKSDVFSNLAYACFYSSVAPIKPTTYICFGKELFEGPKVIHDATDPLKAFNIVMSGGIKGINVETIRGSSGKFHDFEQEKEIKKVLETYLSYRVIERGQWSSLTLSPRIIDSSLGIPSDTKGDSPTEIYEYVKNSLQNGKFPSYDMNKKITIRLGKERVPVFSFNVQPDSPI
jgi:L-asparaginase/Glu-tRNA(Gln) amidotransferase subunit D